jgi:C1A family cysteine protease
METIMRWVDEIYYYFKPMYSIGYERDYHDDRDHNIVFESTPDNILPSKIDLRKQSPYVFNQAGLPSCTQNAVCAQFDWIQDKNHKKDINAKKFIPSRLFLYYNVRKMEGNALKRTGTTIRNTIVSAVKTGICEEKIWPYDIKKFDVEPSKEAYENSQKNLIAQYARVTQNELQIKLCLKQGHPISFGMIIFDPWYYDKNLRTTGIIPLPKSTDKRIGGHAMLIIGYDDNKKWFIVQNSWGNQWGDKGYCYIPYSYILDKKLAYDFWVIRDTMKPDLSFTIQKK